MIGNTTGSSQQYTCRLLWYCNNVSLLCFSLQNTHSEYSVREGGGGGGGVVVEFRSEPIVELKYILDIQNPINNLMSKLKKNKTRINIFSE